MIAERINEYMLEKGLKQTTLASHLGMEKSSMSATLNGKRTLTAEEYVSICDFFEVPYSKFAHDPDDTD